MKKIWITSAKLMYGTLKPQDEFISNPYLPDPEGFMDMAAHYVGILQPCISNSGTNTESEVLGLLLQEGDDDNLYYFHGCESLNLVTRDSKETEDCGLFITVTISNILSN